MALPFHDSFAPKLGGSKTWVAEVTFAVISCRCPVRGSNHSPTHSVVNGPGRSRRNGALAAAPVTYASTSEPAGSDRAYPSPSPCIAIINRASIHFRRMRSNILVLHNVGESTVDTQASSMLLSYSGRDQPIIGFEEPVACLGEKLDHMTAKSISRNYIARNNNIPSSCAHVPVGIAPCHRNRPHNRPHVLRICLWAIPEPIEPGQRRLRQHANDCSYNIARW